MVTFESDVGVEAGSGAGEDAGEAEGEEAAGAGRAPVLPAGVAEPDADDEQDHHQVDDREDTAR